MQITEQISNSELCWFCRKNRDHAKTRAIFSLHKNHKTDYMIFWLRHRWEQLKTDVPRCAVCCAVHRKARRMGNLIGWILVIVSFLLCLMLTFIIADILNSEKLGFLPFLCVPIPILCFFLGRWIGQDIVHSSAPDVKPIKFGQTYPSIELLRKEGWKEGIPFEN